MNGRVEQALALRNLGFHIFALPEFSKKAARTPFKDLATRDTEKIKQWFTDRPNANIGIYCGKYGDNGQAIIGVDVDVKNGKNGKQSLLRLEREGCQLPRTFVQSTPTGGEHHLYVVDHPVGQSVGKLGEGLDIRSTGGYLVAAGSVVEAGPYTTLEIMPPTPAPYWLIERCGRPRDAAPAATVPVENIDADAATARAAHYLKIEAPMAIEGSGGDSTTYAVAARVKDLGIADADACAALMLEAWNPRCSPPWDPAELRTKCRNAYAYGKAPVGAAAPETVFDVVPPSAPSAHPSRRFTAKAFKDTLPELDFVALIEDVLPVGGLGMLCGKPGELKTFVVMDMGLAIARGIPWQDRPVEAGAVLLVAAEGKVSNRLAAYRQHHKLGKADIPFFTIESSCDLFRSADVQPLIDEANDVAQRAGKPLRLIAIDTLACVLAGGDENSGQDMGRLLDNVRKLQRATGAAVVLVHHLGKDETRGARGHSSLFGAVDTSLEIKNGVMTVEKQRDGKTGIRFGFQAVTVPIGKNDKGQVIDSCVVVPHSVTAAQAFRVKQFKPESVPAKALAVLGDLTLADGKPVALDAWREEFITRHYPGTGQKRIVGINAFTRAQSKLTQHHRIDVEDNRAIPKD